VIDNHTLSVYRGDLKDYTTARKNDVTNGKSTNTDSRRGARQDRANQRASLKQLRDEVRKFEKQMQREQASLTALETKLADPEAYGSLPASELDNLLAEAGKIRISLAKTEEQWLESSTQLDQISD
jgi:ATP-binding cassette subfamily F protein 3